MAYFPLESKELIQLSYIRFKELTDRIKRIESDLVFAEIAKWGGGLVFASSLLPNGASPEMAGLAGTTGLVGWWLSAEMKKKLVGFRRDLEGVNAGMKKIDITMYDNYGEVQVFIGDIANGTRLWPFNDENYH